MRFKETGRWGFEEFKPETGQSGTLPPDSARACFQCHAGSKAKGFVFSTIRP